jgi:hypothetical protein
VETKREPADLLRLSYLYQTVPHFLSVFQMRAERRKNARRETMSKIHFSCSSYSVVFISCNAKPGDTPSASVCNVARSVFVPKQKSSSSSSSSSTTTKLPALGQECLSNTRTTAYQTFIKNLEGRHHLPDQDVDRGVTLKWVPKRKMS